MPEEPFDLIEHLNELRKNTESGVALVTAAIIDEWLQKLLLTAMRDGLSNTVANRILGPNGPLYEFAPKIDVAYAFGLIDEAMMSSLRVLKDIRNAFAHTRDVLHFESEQITVLCKKLPGWNKGTNNRTLFDAVALACTDEIDRRTQQIMFSRAADSTSPGK